MLSYDYNERYRQGIAESFVGAHDFAGTLSELNVQLQSSGNRHMMKAAAYAAFHWIQQRMPRGSKILDLGCGTGTFLALLTAHGYECYGLDVAEEPVSRLAKRGYQVRVGDLSAYPPDWPQVEVVSLLEVLEHLEDPRGTIAEIRRRFPHSSVLVTVPSGRFWGAKSGPVTSDYPPNHLTRWTPKALKQLLESCGYRASVVLPAPSSSEWSGTGIVTRIRALRRRSYGVSPTAPPETMGGTERSLALLTALKRLVLAPYMAYLRLRGFSAASMLAIAVPDHR